MKKKVEQNPLSSVSSQYTKALPTPRVAPNLAGKKGAKIYGVPFARDRCDENIVFMVETGSRDETLPLQTGMHGYKNGELVDGEVSWSLIPSAR